MKYAVFKQETMVESILSDIVTAVMLAGAIAFSHHMDTPVWTAITFCMFGLWMSVKLPMENERIVKFSTKREAIEWANSLPDDNS